MNIQEKNILTMGYKQQMVYCSFHKVILFLFVCFSQVSTCLIFSTNNTVFAELLLMVFCFVLLLLALGWSKWWTLSLQDNSADAAVGTFEFACVETEYKMRLGDLRFVKRLCVCVTLSRSWELAYQVETPFLYFRLAKGK